MRQQLKEAADLSADIAHVSECALSGYPGAEYSSGSEPDWKRIDEEIKGVLGAACT